MLSTRLAAIVREMPFSISSAASFQPRCVSIITPERITDEGFTLSWPAYFGAVPWVASKMPWPVW